MQLSIACVNALSALTQESLHSAAPEYRIRPTKVLVMTVASFTRGFFTWLRLDEF